MKILLQSFETGLYLTALGAWTIEIADALDFPSVVQATEYQITRRVAQAFVVVTSDPAPAKAPARAGRRSSGVASLVSDAPCGQGAKGIPTMHEHNPRGGSPAPLQVHRPAEPLTVIEAVADTRPGAELYIRGEGNGLSWDFGQRLLPGFANTWLWSSSKASGVVRFKLLLNDVIWARGNDMEVSAGSLVQVAPTF
jgi:hypothetical protein